MKQFLTKLGIFFLPLAVVALALDYVVTEGLKKSDYADYAEWNALFGGRINADIVIHGSSLAWTQISPQVIDTKTQCESYNLGMDGSSFHTQYFRYLSYEQHNERPDVIIQILDTNTLWQNPVIYNYRQFIPYLDDPNILAALQDSKGISATEKAIPFARYFGEYKLVAVGLAEFFGVHHFINRKYKGYQAMEGPFNPGWINHYNTNKLVVRVEKNSSRLFEEFLKHCQESGIKLFLVHAPLYTENQAVIANYQEIAEVYQDLAGKYDTPILDYSNHPISYRKELFLDGVHLNKQGAELFTGELVDDLIQDYNLKPCEALF